MRRIRWLIVASLALSLFNAAEAQSDSGAADAARQQKIAEFTQKMKDANYPALFEKAAAEFNVPPDVLKAVAFAETRWEQLQWPPGEAVSPDNGMPHAYGIMSLWDNDYFGHSLQEAAKLIGKSPGELKQDAYQNMRGGAALLRKLYDETPKPADAPGDEIESWRKAIAKYTGIPQPELSEAHALRVYEFMNAGYHEYGIEWPAHPVNLAPMREDVARIKSAASAARLGAKLDAPPASASTNKIPRAAESKTNSPPVTSAGSPSTSYGPTPAAQIRQRWLLSGLLVVLLGIAVVYLRRPRPD